jgi:hypothetical protein
MLIYRNCLPANGSESVRTMSLRKMDTNIGSASQRKCIKEARVILANVGILMLLQIYTYISRASIGKNGFCSYFMIYFLLLKRRHNHHINSKIKYACPNCGFERADVMRLGGENCVQTHINTSDCR